MLAKYGRRRRRTDETWTRGRRIGNVGVVFGFGNCNSNNEYETKQRLFPSRAPVYLLVMCRIGNVHVRMRIPVIPTPIYTHTHTPRAHTRAFVGYYAIFETDRQIDTRDGYTVYRYQIESNCLHIHAYIRIRTYVTRTLRVRWSVEGVSIILPSLLYFTLLYFTRL